MFPLTFEEYLGMKEFYKYSVNPNLLIWIFVYNVFNVEIMYLRKILNQDV